MGNVGMHPGLISKERCTKKPRAKVKTFLWRNTHFWKNAYLFRKFHSNRDCLVFDPAPTVVLLFCSWWELCDDYLCLVALNKRWVVKR